MERRGRRRSDPGERAGAGMLQVNWSDLLAAFALYMVLEGILPFLNPQALRRIMLSFANVADAHLRLWGLVSMSLGVALLYFVRS